MKSIEETRFIGQEITVEFDKEPALEKKPHAPNRFIWENETHTITDTLSEWTDFERRGRMQTNMRPENARRARQKGSWGVGRFYFRVRLTDGRVFDLYYDRTPKGTRNRKGSWHLFRQILNQAA